MPNIGPMELAIVLIIALIVFGPKKLPDLGKSLGNGLREFKASVSGEDESPNSETASAGRLEATSGPAEDESPKSTETTAEPRPTADVA